MFGVVNKKQKSGDLKFNGERPIKSVPSVGDVPGGKTIVEVVENIFWRFIKATISLNPIPLQEVGAAHAVRLIGKITKNDETFIGNIRVSIQYYDSIPVWDHLSDSVLDLDYIPTGSLSVVPGVNYKYKYLADVGGNGSPYMLESVERASEGVFPYLYGASDNPDLSGLDLYNTLTRVLQKEGNKQIEFNGVDKYFYFCFHESYDDLSEVIDQNGFSLSDFLASKETREVVSINGWKENYKVYRSSLTTINNGTYKFNR